MDNLKNFRRTNYCGDLRLGDTGKTVSLCGWVQRQRDQMCIRDRSNFSLVGVFVTGAP